jgi:hypothetical protein
MDYDCQAPTITYSAPLAFNDNSHSSQSWLWAIMLLSQAVKFCHSLIGRARHPICHVSPASFRVMQRAECGVMSGLAATGADEACCAEQREDAAWREPRSALNEIALRHYGCLLARIRLTRTAAERGPVFSGECGQGSGSKPWIST